MRLNKIGNFNRNLYDSLKRKVENSLEEQVDKIRKELLLWFRLAVKDKWKLPRPQYDESGREQPRPPYILEPDEYFSSIVSSVEKSTKGFSLTISIRDGVHEASGMTWVDLHKLREYGSESLKVEANPVWLPLWLKFRSRIPGFTLDIKNIKLE